MKKFISTYWNKILLAIGSVSLFLILISKFVAPKTVIGDYVKYGKDILPSSSDNSILGSVTGRFKLVFGNADPELVRLTIILMVGILTVVLLTTIASAAGAKKEAKKK